MESYGPNKPSIKSPTIDFDEYAIALMYTFAALSNQRGLLSYAKKMVWVRRDGWRKHIESQDLVVG